MPKVKKPPETQAEQSARFEAEVQRLVDAGELNRTEAEASLNMFIKQIKPQQSMTESGLMTSNHTPDNQDN